MTVNLPLMAFTALLETALNRYLQADPEILHKFNDLNGKVFLLNITGLNWSLYCLPHAQGINIQSQYAGIVDTTLTAPPLTLFKTALQSTPDMSGELNIQGDVAAGQRLQKLLQTIDLDIEALLAKYLGDIPAHQLNYTQQRLQHWHQQLINNFSLNTQEYLQYEIHWLPTHTELNTFYRHVDNLKNDTARLQARIERLQHNLTTDA